MALFIEIKAADGLVSRTRLQPGSNRFTVRLGDSYRVVDDQTGLTPQGLAVKRVDNNLIVDRLDAANTSVEFVEFYSVCSAGSPCDFTVESGSGSASAAITPATQPIGALADGSFVLYDATYAETAPPAPSGADGTIVRNVLYGLGGLAVVGLAVGGGGGGDDDGGGPPASSSAFRLTSPQVVNTRTPTLTGEGEPGSRVIVRIDTNGDGTPDLVYNTPVGADSKWSVNLASAVPESGALPAGGLPDSSNISITSATPTGNVSLPVFALAFDGTPPGAPVIAAVGGDDQISISERADGVVVSGSAEGNALVVVTLGAQSQAAQVTAQGGWQVSFAPTAVGADGPVRISAVVTDPAGNTGEAAVRTATVNTLPVINPITGDGQINLSEWASGVAVTGTNPAGTRAGVDMAVTVAGISRVVQTDAAGNWSALYSAAELPSSGSAPVSVTPSINGVAGATATSSASVATAPTITSIAGDNVITLGERGGEVTVAGTTPAGTGAGVALTVGLGSATRAAQTDANGNWSAAFPGIDTPVSGGVGASAVANASGATGQPAAGSARMDTAPTLGSITADGIVNATERTGTTPGFISGSAPLGAPDNSQVIVTLAGLGPVAATVSGGAWSLPVSALRLPEGNADYAVTAVGNIGGVSGEAALGNVRVDVTPAPIVGVFTAFNNEISQVELNRGFAIVGSSEPGVTVSLTLGGTTKPVVVAPVGTWTAETFVRTDFPTLATDPDGPLALAITVTNAEGNVSQFSQSIPVEAPGLLPAPLIPVTEPVVPVPVVPAPVVPPPVVPVPAPLVPVPVSPAAATTLATDDLLVSTAGSPTAYTGLSQATPVTADLSTLLQALEQQGYSSL